MFEGLDKTTKKKRIVHLARVFAERVTEAQFNKLVDKLIEQASEGDVKATTWILSKFIPDFKDRLLHFRLPYIHNYEDCKKALNAIKQGIADGQLTISEAKDLQSMVKTDFDIINSHEIEQRLSNIERVLKISPNKVLPLLEEIDIVEPSD